ncbi:MAG: hypothetical protein IPK73_12495 [Candidatus Obscuribacter sp.]|nr:hypothetical protein [Candidatus Obscuribacter sp.]MBK9281839.1 hypothetical protein [Candidatus Obscuribacter sp.]
MAFFRSIRAISLCLLLALAVPAARAQTAGNWLKLEQHSELFGNYDVYICQDSFVLHTLESDVHVVFKPPHDHITFFSKRTGKVVDVPIDKGTFVNPFAKARTILTGVSLSYIPMEPDKLDNKDLPASLSKLNLDCFKSTEAFTKLQKKRNHDKELTGGAPKSCRAVVLKDGPAGKKVLFILSRLQDISPMPGIPVKVDFDEIGGDKRTYLKTYRVVKTADASKLLLIPGNLQKVRDPQAVMQDNSADDAMRLMILDSQRR